MTRKLLAGVDEVGRGPLAGPVVAAAVILDPRAPSIEGLTDSKLLSASKRVALASAIREHALAWSIGRADSHEIDAINILQASLLAMRRAIMSMPLRPTRVLVDGKHCPQTDVATQAIVQGDRTVEAISAASILAKVSRDAEMCMLDCRFPAYGFARHKGYPTREHCEALMSHGVTPIHRRSFAPVRRALVSDS